MKFRVCYAEAIMNPFETPPSQPSQEKPQDKETVLSPEELIQAKEWGLTPEEFLLAQAYQDELDREAAIPKVGEEECEQKVKELDDLLKAFEITHPIQELYAVTELDGKDVALNPEKYPVRTAAKKDLAPIVTALNFLKDRTTLSSERYEELHARYKYFLQAIGAINNGKVDHTR